MHAILPLRLILFISLLILLAAGAGGAYIYLPQANIVIRPAMREEQISQAITLSSDATEPDFVHFVLPAKIIEAQATQEITVERTNATVTEAFAHGTIRLTNKQTEPQSLLPKTHLRHEASGVFFLTDTPVLIPARGEVTVAVTAKEQGAQGNVLAGTFIVDKLPADIQSEVFGESTQTFSGGEIVESPITQEDISKAQEEATKQATEKALGSMTEKTKGAPVRSDLTTTEITNMSSSANVGDFDKSFRVSVTVTSKSFLASENDLLSLAVLALRSNTQQGEEFISYSPNSFAIASTHSDFARNTSVVSIVITGTYARDLSSNIASAQNLVGLSADEVVGMLESQPGVGEVTVSFSPFWVTAVPARANSVHISLAPAS